MKCEAAHAIRSPCSYPCSIFTVCSRLLPLFLLSNDVSLGKIPVRVEAAIETHDIAKATLDPARVGETLVQLTRFKTCSQSLQRRPRRLLGPLLPSD